MFSGVIIVRYIELKTEAGREAQRQANIAEKGEAASIEDEKTDGEGLVLPVKSK